MLGSGLPKTQQGGKKLLQQSSQDPMRVETHSRGIILNWTSPPKGIFSKKADVQKKKRGYYSSVDQQCYILNCPQQTLQQHLISQSIPMTFVSSDNLSLSFYRWKCLSTVLTINSTITPPITLVMFILTLQSKKTNSILLFAPDLYFFWTNSPTLLDTMTILKC